MALFLAPVCQGQAIDVDGNPRTGGKIYTYLAGTSTPTATYTTEAGSTPHANPIILNSLGQTPNPIWITSGLSYKLVETDSADVVIRTTDNIDGVNDTTQTASEWFDSGFTPTYINATSFSVSGDRTSTLQIGRRLKTTNTGGAIYSTITNSVFGALTTVTVTNDSGTLDAGLSLVAYGLLSATNPSVPATYAKSGAVTASGITMSTARALLRTTAGTGAIEEATAAQLATFAGAVTVTGAQTVAGVKTFSDAPIFSAGFGAGNTNQSCISVHTANGFGSTNTKIRRFTTSILSQGTDITYADSATNGASFTINVAGIYAVSYVDSGNAATAVGLSLNSSQLTTAVGAITAADRLATQISGAASYHAEAVAIRYFAASAVIRPHSDGLPVGATDNTMFTITRLS